MPDKPTPSLGHYVQMSFSNYLTVQRRLSANTVLSYRDAFKLLLSFAARSLDKSVVALTFADLKPDLILLFLDDLERARGCSVRTRNARLAALHSFFAYVAGHEPCLLDQCHRVAAIPVKKATQIPPEYLEYDEVKLILGAIDRSTPIGRRDHLLIRVLFETGARAEEVATMRASAFQLSRPCQVRILGKGDKERLCPIRENTAALIRTHLAEWGIEPSAAIPVFIGVRGQPLTRYGILRAVQRHARAAAKAAPSLARKRIGVHTFRHSAAIHLLRSGNALPVIRTWLGHVSVTTTDLYTEIDLEMKRKALEKCTPLDSAESVGAWKPDADLLSWLEAL